MVKLAFGCPVWQIAKVGDSGFSSPGPSLDCPKIFVHDLKFCRLPVRISVVQRIFDFGGSLCIRGKKAKSFQKKYCARPSTAAVGARMSSA